MATMRKSKCLVAIVVIICSWQTAAIGSDIENQEPAVSRLWSLRPVLPSSAPGGNAAGVIDQHIRARLSKERLKMGKRASAERQVRRLSLLLTGLPPDYLAVRQFAEDSSEEHYAALVDRYLASPHFGERWARHWMDVVRFAETYGYEWNFLIRDAWRYRDYLIRAFNQDVPYNQFVREHLAGDLLPNPRKNISLGINESVIGTAFFRLGETGHDDCRIYRDIGLDVMDNQIDTLSKAFQALTVSCARCHDHKLDTISQADYYSLLGVMASSRQVMHTLDLPQKQAGLKQRMRDLKNEIRLELANIWLQEANIISVKQLDIVSMSPIGPTAGQPQREPAYQIEHPLFVWHSMSKLSDEQTWRHHWAELCHQYQAEQSRRKSFNERFTVFADFADINSVAELNGQTGRWSLTGNATDNGFASHGDFSVLHEGKDVFGALLPAGFYTHSISQKLNATLRSPLLPSDRNYVSYQVTGQNKTACRTILDNCQLPFFHTQFFETTEFSWIQTESANIAKHHAYLEWVTLFDNQAYPNLNTPGGEYRKALNNPRSYFGITKVLLHDTADKPLTELDAPLRVVQIRCESRQSLADRYRYLLKKAIHSWARDDASEADVAWINLFCRTQCLSRNVDASPQLNELITRYRSLESQLDQPSVIVGMADQGPGFDMPVYAGGDPDQPTSLAKRGYLSCLANIVDTPQSRGSGRALLAEYIATDRNPLTARVMANRIWHYLFGKGLVKSVDNFGELGDRPSHPKLLDYLARDFIDGGWSVKSLIRQTVLSDTFRQSSTVDEVAAQLDPENRLLHHYPSRRLEAEVIRDSILSVSGSLDPTLFGPSIDPYREKEIDSRRLYVGPLDGDGRRSLYLRVTRMGPSKLLTLFNLPDPGMTTGRRDTTNVPTQALGLLNHPFVHQQAQRHAQRWLAVQIGDFESRFRSLYAGLLGRMPTQREITLCHQLFEQLCAYNELTPQAAIGHSGVWKEFVHAMYNLKEFTYVL